MMFRKFLSVLTLVVGLTLSFNVSADTPAKTHAAPKTEKKTRKPKKSRVQADDQSSSVSELNYHQINDCLTQAGVQWKGMKHHPETGEYVLEGPKKNGLPEFYLVMGKAGLYRIDTKDLKDNSLVNLNLGESKRKAAWAKKSGLWLQQSEKQSVPEKFKNLQAMEYDAKVQQYDKMVRALVAKPVASHYRAGIRVTLANASSVVADSRKPRPEILSEVEKMNALITKYKDQETQLRSQYQNGALTRTELDSRLKLGGSLVNVNQAGIKAISALQAQRETRSYTPSERLMAYQAIDNQWAQSPLKAGLGACENLLGKDTARLFPKQDPYGVAQYARLRLMGSAQ